MKSKQSLSLNFTRKQGRGFWRFLSDSLIGVLLYAGLLGMIKDSFALSFSLFLPVIAGAWVIIAGLLPEKLRRIKTVLIVLLLAGTLAVVLLKFPAVRDGFCLSANAIADTFGMAGRKITVHLAVSAGADTAQCLTLFFLPAGVILALLCRHMAENGNRLLGFLFLLFGLLSGFITGRTVSAPFLICLLAGEVLLFLSDYYRQRAERLHGDGQAVLVHAALCGIVFAAVCGISLTTASRDNTKEAAFAANLQDRTAAFAETIRYGGKTHILPLGQFNGLEDLQEADNTALTVTMSLPDSYYLRGFVGEAYTGSGWKSLDEEQAYSFGNLFYWLHEEGFYGQLQLSEAAVLLDRTIFAEDINTVTVQTEDAGRKYVYVPYELSAIDDSFVSSSSIGDERAKSTGFYGRDSYTYQVLPNQVKRYTDLVSALNARKTEAGQIEEYLTKESWYNSWVYEAYTDLDDSLRDYLSGKVGEVQTEEGYHLSYQQAKQKILSFLTENVHYSTSPGGYTTSDGDFLTAFLEDGWGYSVHYATAAALLFRYFGIPARYVEGYLITPEDAESMVSGEPFAVSEARAHAWAEFYQDGIGWVPFEVTPPYMNIMEQPDIYQGYDDRTLPEEGPDKSSEEMTDDNYLPDEEKTIDPAKAARTALTIVQLLILIAALLLLVHILKKRSALKKRLNSFSQSGPKQGIVGLFSYCLELLAALHIRKGNGSAYDMTGQVEEKLGTETAELFRRCTGLCEEAAFSEHEMAENQREQMLQLKNKLVAALQKDNSPLRRLRLRLIEGIY